MLKTIKKLLEGDPAEGIAAIDVPALEAALADAQQRRAAILLDGSVDEILAAERAVDVARIELERGRLALAELERRKAEAEAATRRRDRDKQRTEVQVGVERVTSALLGKATGLLAEIDKIVDDAVAADRAAYYTGQRLINARVDGEMDEDEDIFLPSVYAWLSTPDAENLPSWFRARIYEHIREWHDVR